MKTEVRLLFPLLISLMASSCSTSATITMAEGARYSGKIVDSDRDFVYIEANRNNREFSVPKVGLTQLKKVDIVSIDHPGNVHFLIGGILTGVGAFYGGIGLVVLSESDGNSYNNLFAYQLLLASAVYLGVGLPMGVWGWSTWDESKSLAEREGDSEQTQTRPRMLFLPMTRDQQVSSNEGLDSMKWGFSLQASF